MRLASRCGARIAAGAAVLTVVALTSSPAPATDADSTPLAPPRTRGPAIAFVPLDDRPVTLQLPVMLGAIAGQPVLRPPMRDVGHYLDPGDGDALLAWLRALGPAEVSALVASTDMIAYGGLVASRVPGDSDVPFARVRELATFKAGHPAAYVAGFGTVMRLAPTGVPAGTPAWAAGQTVDDIQAYANLHDPPQSDGERARALHLRDQIGARTLAAYLGARRRNRLVDQTLIGLTAHGGFDRLVLGQDDAGPVGLHLRDLAMLRATVAREAAGGRVAIEPGADELGMALLGRVFARNVGWTPHVRVVYSRPDAASYNDRLEFAPIDVTITRLIEACGGRRDDAQPDMQLFVRVPLTTDEQEHAFVDAIAARDPARLAAVTDLTFLEGGPGPGQRALTDDLIARHLAGGIDAYASWNTTANTIGTALAQAIAVGAGRRAGRYDPRAQASFLLDRYIDDYAFHQFVRPAVNDALRAGKVDTTLLDAAYALEAASLNRAALWPHALELSRAIFPEYRDGALTITLPWDRTFETKIDVDLQPR